MALRSSKAHTVSDARASQFADLTEGEFDALLDAKGDVNKLPREIWKRPPSLPTKHLGPAVHDGARSGIYAHDLRMRAIQATSA